jgi:20S proteasome alpha/beta subunit
VVPDILAKRLGLYVHYYTLHSSLRPFGSTALIAGYDEDLKTAELYMVEPSGVRDRGVRVGIVVSVLVRIRAYKTIVDP